MTTVTMLTKDELLEIRKWANEALNDPLGDKWRELTLILVQRTPSLVEMLLETQAEITHLKFTIEDLQSSLRLEQQTLQRNVSTFELIRLHLKKFWDETLPINESLEIAASMVEKEINKLERERDLLQDRVRDIAERLNEYENQILMLENSSAASDRTQSRAEELTRVVDELRLGRQFDQSRLVSLENEISSLRQSFGEKQERYERTISELEEKTRNSGYEEQVRGEDILNLQRRLVKAEEENIRLSAKLLRVKDSLLD